MVRSFLVAFAILVSVAPIAVADKVSDANVASCKRFYTEINKGNMNIIDELVDDSFVEHEEFPGMPSGKEGLRMFFKTMRSAFPDFKMVPEFFVANGDMVSCYIQLSGTHKGEFMGMPATGKKFKVNVVDIIRITDGKAVEHWGVSDMMGMMQQLGAMGHGEHEEHGEGDDED